MRTWFDHFKQYTEIFRGMEKIKTRLFTVLKTKNKGKVDFYVWKGKLSFWYNFSKSSNQNPRFWMRGFLNMFFSKIYDSPKNKHHLHVRTFFGFSVQKFVHPPFPPNLISSTKHVQWESENSGEGRAWQSTSSVKIWA
jgi:hypothetical protein